MEENVDKLEQRLRNENQSLQEFYDKKIGNFDIDKAQLIDSYEIRLKSVEERYESLLDKMKSHHDDELENIKNDHRNMIQNIRYKTRSRIAVFVSRAICVCLTGNQNCLNFRWFRRIQVTCRH